MGVVYSERINETFGYILHSVDEVTPGTMPEPRERRDDIVALIADLTERRSGERDALLVRLDDETRPLTGAGEIVRTSARLLGEYLRADRCAYSTFEADEDTLEVDWDYTEPGVASVVGRYVLSDFGIEARRLLRADIPFVVEDIESDARTGDVRNAYREAGIRAHATVPLHKAGRLAALMFVHQTTPRVWLPDEVELLRTVANRCWESIERVRVTRALRLSERRLRLAQKVARIGTFEWQMNSDQIVWTPELESLYGLAEGEFEGALSDWARRVVDEDAQRVLSGIEGCVSRREPEFSYEFRAVLPDGSRRWLRGHAQFIYGETGAAERMIGVNIDIDAQKQAEDRLREQWHTFDTALSHTPDFTYIFDLDGRFTYVNRALLSLWGRSLEESVGKNFFDLEYPPDLAQKLQRQIQRVIETGNSLRDQTPFAGPTGEIREYEYIFVPVLGSGGKVRAVAGSTRDITEARRAGQRELERQEQIRESARLESLGLMAGGIAHDFNNLLTGILGNASLLAEDVPEGSRAIAREIVLASERAADLTLQMLAYSGKGRFDIRIFDLNGLVRDNLTFLRASLARSVGVRLEPAGEPAQVQADRSQIQQVVMNLLINAAEAAEGPEGAVTVRTWLTTRHEPRYSACLQAQVAAGSYGVIEVRDNGIGMSAATLRKIFDPFFTTKFTGRGLGLAAVLGIVKGHKGDIEVESDEGRGTTFRIYLPASSAAAEPETIRDLHSPAHASGRTVLVVDDEEMVRRMASMALERGGYRAVQADNGDEALAVLRANADISLVILDLTMPVLSGEQAIPLIRNLSPEVPIVLSSGFDESEVARRFASTGIAAVLQKPYTARTLLAKVAEAFETASPKRASPADSAAAP